MNKSREKFNSGELFKGFVQTYRKLDFELRKFLKPFGITIQQYNVLEILRGAKKPLTTSLIRERMIEPMADTSRLVDRLFTKGLVERIASVKDRRLVDVTISSEGIDFIDQIKNIDQVLENLYRNINQKEANQLNFLLNKLRG